MIKQRQPGTQIPGCCSMYAPPKTAVLVSVVLSFVPVAGGTFLRLLCLVSYPVELCHHAFSFRRLLFFGWFSLDLLLPFRKLPLILLYYALSLIVGGHECLPIVISIFANHTGNILRHLFTGVRSLLQSVFYDILSIVTTCKNRL